jgi:membrane fusion protein (multidrug efflux system)
VLYALDDASYRAAHGVAEANLARAQAKAASLKRSLQRQADLLRIDGVSRQEYEDTESAVAQAGAEVSAARAALDAARVDLERTRIRAAISGRIGRSSVSEGALVTRDQQAALSSIVQLDEVYVDIVQPSQELVRLQQQRQAGGLQAASARVRLRMEGGIPYAHSGSLRFNEVSVDPASGAVTLRARFPNPEGLLMPGMYVRASVEQGVAPQALLVPHQGLEHDEQGQARVLVVNAQARVEARPVQADTLVDGQWVVRSGLRAGEQVIVEGRRRVEVGQSVKPVPIGPEPAAQVAGEGPVPRKGG